MNSLLDLLRKSTDFLAKKGVGNARLQSELIFAGTLGSTFTCSSTAR